MNRRSRRNLWIGLGVLALLAAVLLAVRLLSADRRLTRMPEQRVGGAVAHDALSFVSVSIRLRYEALAQLLDEQVPASFPIPEASLLGGRFPATAVQGAGQLERRTPFTVAGAGDGVLARTRLHAAYTLGNAVLGEETLQAEADVALALAFDLDEQWKPVIQDAPGFEWIQRPESRLTRMFNLSLADVATGQATALLARVEQRLPALVEQRFQLAGLVEQSWQAAHARIPLAAAPATSADAPMQRSPVPAPWLTIQPQSAHFLTPRADGDALRLDTGFSARFQVSTDPAGKQPPAVEGIRLAVPVSVDYRTLSDVLADALRDRVFAFDVGGRPAEVRIDEVTVYPSAPRVVLGLHVDADLPRQWMDTRGWIYLSATPAFDAKTGTLTLHDLDVARAVDNAWVRVFSTALHARLVRELEQHARLELAGPLERATQSANAMLHAQLRQLLESRLQGGPVRLAERIQVEGGLQGIESVELVLGEDQVTVVPVVTGSLAVELVPLYAPATASAPAPAPAVSPPPPEQ
jgi:hypothetical protein